MLSICCCPLNFFPCCRHAGVVKLTQRCGRTWLLAVALLHSNYYFSWTLHPCIRLPLTIRVAMIGWITQCFLGAHSQFVTEPTNSWPLIAGAPASRHLWAILLCLLHREFALNRLHAKTELLRVKIFDFRSLSCAICDSRRTRGFVRKNTDRRLSVSFS